MSVLTAVLRAAGGGQINTERYSGRARERERERRERDARETEREREKEREGDALAWQHARDS